MATWRGSGCRSPFATFAGTGGYPNQRTHKIVPRRNADLCCGTKAALTAGHGKRGSRRVGAARFRRGTIDDDRSRHERDSGLQESIFA